MAMFQVGDFVRVRRPSSAPDVLHGEEGHVISADGEQYVVRLQDDNFPVAEEDLESAEQTAAAGTSHEAHGGSHV